MLPPIQVTPKLTYNLWHQKVFEGITNSFGSYVTMDEVRKVRYMKVEAKFYVMVKFRISLPQSITLDLEIGKIEQEIWYEYNNCLCQLLSSWPSYKIFPNQENKTNYDMTPTKGMERKGKRGL